MNERFKFYIIYHTGLNPIAIETTHQDWTKLIDSFKNRNYEIKKVSHTEDVNGEKHAFMNVYVISDHERFDVGWIDELID